MLYDLTKEAWNGDGACFRKPFADDRFTYMVLSVNETSARLGITSVRVRQLISAGTLPAVKVGRQYILQEADVERFSPRRRGRPASPASAWAFLQYLSEDPSGWSGISSGMRQRHIEWTDDLRRLPSSLRPIHLAALVRARAETRFLSADRHEIPDLLRDQFLTITGVSHPQSGLLNNAEVEAYIREEIFQKFRREWLLVPANPKEANVILHVAQRLPSALPLAAVAADLAEHRGEREQGQAEQILEDLLHD
ncbi:helix-turn-helix domain-containing protein [Arthrobacter echini]|uniref:Helix-turn-helix domain-containing protein n=2 Tax=Arthrobacter TaxID=1663 RepID=A0A4S5E9Y7_9MICC|nr:helix-turn-helix domain-containing protein [Arthrobacter echini]THJ68488.1 helix-turn-helix domain-containing protein [Arthrobacter echini]